MERAASVGAAMRRTMLKYFPQLGDVKVDYAWGGYVAITANRQPAPRIVPSSPLG